MREELIRTTKLALCLRLQILLTFQDLLSHNCRFFRKVGSRRYCRGELNIRAQSVLVIAARGYFYLISRSSAQPKLLIGVTFAVDYSVRIKFWHNSCVVFGLLDNGHRFPNV